MLYAGDEETVRNTDALKVGGPPHRRRSRAELLRLIRRTEFSLRELASGRDGGLSGIDRYTILQVANPLLAAFLCEEQERRLHKQRRHQEFLRREEERRARRHQLFEERRLRKAAASQPIADQPPLPPLEEIYLTDISAAWQPVARKLPSGAWHWALPAGHLIGFEAERHAGRIIVIERPRAGHTVLFARRQAIPPVMARAEAAQFVAALPAGG